MPILELKNVHARYAHAPVLRGIDVSVDAGEVITLLGRNGAGKTTTLKTVMGWLHPYTGEIRFRGQVISSLPTDRICRLGIGYIPEDRCIFPALSVEENLYLGLLRHWRKSRAAKRKQLDRIYSWFPQLAERRKQSGRTLSGGEQQMLAIARGLAADPQLLLIDEPSEGLAPMLVQHIFGAIRRMRDEGLSILLVEQNVMGAANVSDRCFVIEKGRVVGSGTSQEILGNEQLRRKLAV